MIFKEKENKLVKYTRVIFGCDPEFFFETNGQVIGAEKLLPEEGLDYDNKHSVLDVVGDEEAGKIIIDGVQAELNPRPNICRQSLALEIGLCFQQLQKELEKNKDVQLNLKQLIEVEPKEFASLSDKSKEFGCGKSHNLYSKESSIKVDPNVYRKRSAGGHIHLGIPTPDPYNLMPIFDKPKKLVALLDILLGNTCVLIDKDKGNIERRENYGLAGEYRKHKGRMEYRTLSNFWLQSYPLMSFVMGMSRFCVNIILNGKEKQFFDRVSMENIEKAINENDFDLAFDNFLKVEPLIAELGYETGQHPLYKANISAFKYFIKKDLDYWFKEDPIKHWAGISKGPLFYGWENFLKNTVTPEMINQNN